MGDSIFKPLLYFHIVCGSTALLIGMLLIFMKKGTAFHVKAGRVYFYAMCFVCASATALCLIKPNTFLLLIAIFSFYFCFMGRQTAKNKNLYPTPLYWALLVLFIITGIFMVFSGKIILMVFSVLIFSNSYSDLRLYLNKDKVDHTKWKLRHIGYMLGSYIATFTAFLVNAVHFSYPLIGWLGPTVLGVPLIIYWIRKERLAANKPVVATEME